MVSSLHKAIDIMFKPFQFTEEEYEEAVACIRSSSLSPFYKKYFESMYDDYLSPERRLKRFSLSISDCVPQSYLDAIRAAAASRDAAN